MNKTLLSAGVALALASGAAQAATLAAGQTFDVFVNVAGSCFTFGDCSGGAGAFVDNDSDATAATGSANASFGSAIAGDGHAGVINITTVDDGAHGVTFSINSFNMDTYLGTAGGAFATQGTVVGTMSGAVNSQGGISLDLTGREGMAQFFNTSLGAQPWNAGATFTSNSQTNAVANLTGASLALDGSAAIVSASAVSGWGFFAGTPYTEMFSLDFSAGAVVASPVPVPAAVWLFGSGLLGLVGVARRKKSA